MNRGVSGTSGLVDVEASVWVETDAAFKLCTMFGSPVWVPKSLVEDNEDGTFTMPEWLAFEKGLI